MSEWWRDAVVYQIYPRSFQDSDGDGVGDLAGIERRLDHLTWLGVDALWLSPIYPSPLADFGYDVADHTAVDPVFGTLEDFDRLLAAAHDRGLRFLLDLVPSHTSIEHRWFREHPEWYVWAEGERPPNNWIAAFGGPSWTRLPGTDRWYLHSFFPEQPDLDWRNPELRKAMGDVVRFWVDRGVDGFRVDAADRLLKDPELRDEPPATAPFGLPLPPEVAEWDYMHSGNAPDTALALAAIREAAGDAVLVGEVYLPTGRLEPYLEYFDQVFAFELLHAPPRAERLAEVIAAGASLGRMAWVLSNHDFPRLATRWAPELAEAAAVLLLTLPGAAFVYQGDELGLPDGPGADPPLDRHGRDGARHPFPWEAGGAGFSDGPPWLPVAAGTSLAEQRRAPGSTVELYRELIALRRELGPGLEVVAAADGLLAYRRGEHLVAINLSGEERPLPNDPPAAVRLATAGGLRDGALAPGTAAVLTPA
jgi:alpha-glucosidase